MNSSKRLLIIRIIVAILATGLVLWGFAHKEQDEVRTRGSHICVECTGLG